jgi:hypothetical protein
MMNYAKRVTRNAVTGHHWWTWLAFVFLVGIGWFLLVAAPFDWGVLIFTLVGTFLCAAGVWRLIR